MLPLLTPKFYCAAVSVAAAAAAGTAHSPQRSGAPQRAERVRVAK